MSSAASGDGRGRTSSSPPELSSGSIKIDEFRQAREKLLRDMIDITVESTNSEIAGRHTVKVRPDDLVHKLVFDFLEKSNIDESNTYILRTSVRGAIIKSSQTIAAAGLKDGDTVYLSSLDPEEQSHHQPRALWSYANWYNVAALCLFLALSVCGGALAAYMLNQYPPELYGIVVDAGSVHTAVYSYRFSGKRIGGTGLVSETHYCEMDQPERAGIASFVNEPKAAVDFINSSCLRESVARIPLEARNRSRLILGSTAGMRVLAMQQPVAAQQILGNLSEALPVLADGMQTSVEVFPGDLEGEMGWVTVNFLKKFLTSPSSSASYGALDWGGASSQITYQATAPVSEDSSKSLSLYGRNYTLFVKSSLCYGQKEALMRYRSSLVYSNYLINNRSLASKLPDPCAPLGSQIRTSYSHLFGYLCTKNKDSSFQAVVDMNEDHVEFVGQPDLPVCKQLISRLLNYTACSSQFESPSGDDTCLDPASIASPSATTTNTPFYAFSTFWYLISALGLPSSHSLDTLDSKAEEVCNSPRSRLLSEGLEEVSDSACFKMLFMRQLLLTGYHFDAESYGKIHFVERIGTAEVGWSLGHMILRSSEFAPPPKGTIYLSELMFVVLIGLSCGLLLLSFFFSYQARTISSPTANSNYQRFPTATAISTSDSVEEA